MRDLDLFQMALGLTSPWFVQGCTFEPDKRHLEIKIDFTPGGQFACPVCGQGACKAHDTEEKRWRHLNFFEHRCDLVARTPRVKCEKCGVHQVAVAWARPGSGFTLLFEAFAMLLARQMPVAAAAQIVGEHDTRLWRLIQHHVDEVRAAEDWSEVKNIGIDETSRKSGHNYITVVVDMDASRVLYATAGKDAATVEAFAQEIKQHQGDPAQIEEACCDMSPSFIKGLGAQFENAEITFDKFHVMKLIGTAVDEVRRAEQKERPELKGSRYVWLFNPDKLKAEYEEMLAGLSLPKLNLKTARAYQMRINFKQFYNQDPVFAEDFLKRWYFWATHSRLEPMIKAARTLKEHWGGVLRWFESGLTNGILEGINSLIQAAKAKARGYRSTRYLITMVYLIAGKLEFNLPT